MKENLPQSRRPWPALASLIGFALAWLAGTLPASAQMTTDQIVRALQRMFCAELRVDDAPNSKGPLQGWFYAEGDMATAWVEGLWPGHPGVLYRLHHRADGRVVVNLKDTAVKYSMPATDALRRRILGGAPQPFTYTLTEDCGPELDPDTSLKQNMIRTIERSVADMYAQRAEFHLPPRELTLIIGDFNTTDARTYVWVKEDEFDGLAFLHDDADPNAADYMLGPAYWTYGHPPHQLKTHGITRHVRVDPLLPCQPGMDHAEVPDLTHMNYDEARAKFLAAGWMPRVTIAGDYQFDKLADDGGGGPTYWSRGYRELEFCDAKFSSPECEFDFVDDAGNRLRVFTEGADYDDETVRRSDEDEARQAVHDTELRCVVH